MPKVVFFNDVHSDGKGDPVTIYPLNANGVRTIQVFSGFRLSDAGFNAVFEAASFIAGVSGDNTFERTISNKLLPFYWSSNPDLKKATSVSLSHIVKERLKSMDIPVEVKRDLETYFSYEKFSDFVNFFRWKEDELAALSQFPDIDLIAMSQAWKQIAQYLIEHHNFYDKLLTIFSEGLDPSLFLSSAPVVPAAASSTGSYAYSQISQWHDKPQEDIAPTSEPIPFSEKIFNPTNKQ